MRWGARLALIAVAAPLVFAGSAHGALTIGHDLETPPTNFVNCDPTCTLAQDSIATGSIASGGFKYAADQGIVTRVRFAVSAAAHDGNVTVAPRALGVNFGGAVGAPVVVADADGIQTFPTRFPIVRDQIVGFDIVTPNPKLGILRTTTGSSTAFWLPPLGIGEARAPLATSANRELLFQADVEADGDGDGFGDETQDACPRQAATAGECVPPNASITKTEKVGRRGVRVYFTADDPLARFTCGVDLDGADPCTSPVTFKRLKPGRHEVRVHAYRDSFDPTPAIAKVKIKKKKKKKRRKDH